MIYVPEWFKKELNLIDPNYFPVEDERVRVIAIRKWNCIYPRPRTWQTDSEELFRFPAEYLSGRLLRDLRKGLWNAKHVRDILRVVDRNNERIDESADSEMEYVSRYMAKRIYHYYREPQIIGGVQGTNRKNPY